MYLRDMKIPVKEPPPPVVEGEVVDDYATITVELGETCGYTSDALEEDFSTAVELMMGSIGFLQLMESYDKDHNFFSEKARLTFEEHVRKVEDFLQQWD